MVSFDNVDAVELTIDLECRGSCQFKLMSSTFTPANTATYTSSQKIKYLVDKPGEHIFYNQFTPAAKFKLSF